MRPITSHDALNPVGGSGMSGGKRPPTDDLYDIMADGATDESVASRPDVAELLQRLVARASEFMHTREEVNKALVELTGLIRELTTVHGADYYQDLGKGVWFGRSTDDDYESDTSYLVVRMYVLRDWLRDPWRAERDISNLIEKLNEMQAEHDEILRRARDVLAVLRTAFALEVRKDG